MTALHFAPDADDAHIVSRLADLVRPDHRQRWAIAGGTTPTPILASLVARALDLSQTEIWPTDDRCVGLDHPASNTANLQRVFAPTRARIHALHPGPTPGPFSLVWLGLGADGHIASLFPRPDVGIDDPAAVIELTPDPLPPEAPFARVTLNYRALLQAERIWIVANGAVKRAVLEAAARGEGDLPVARLARLAAAPIEVFWRP